jgi:sugar O-acyltransferase (sialic acid O-acetyltransferase NeuD family)
MILYGASGHCKVVCSTLENLGIVINAIFDDNKSILKINNYDVAGFYNSNLYADDNLIITIGDNKIRKNISKIVKHNFGKCVSPFSFCDKIVELGNGSIILQGAIVQRDSKIGEHVIINTSSSIDHDCVVGDFVHLSPGARLAGGVYVGEGTHIGLNACVIPNIKIGKWCVIGAGSVITRDIPDYSLVVGVPGKIIKTLQND